MLPHPCVQALAGCARFDWDSRSLACTFYSLSSPREGMVSGQAYCQVSPAPATCPRLVLQLSTEERGVELRRCTPGFIYFYSLYLFSS